MYAYAKTGDLAAMEEFISSPNQANLGTVGENCFNEGLYEAARVVFAHIPNYGRLASTLVRLHQFQAAVDAARKANSPKTWKEACSCSAAYTCIPATCAPGQLHAAWLSHAQIQDSGLACSGRHACTADMRGRLLHQTHRLLRFRHSSFATGLPAQLAAC